jgi:DNA polymerase I-like protein with 3'-5' exonuclease and polymerase domains
VAEIKDLMENCAPGLTIPSKVDVGLGDNWGSAK